MRFSAPVKKHWLGSFSIVLPPSDVRGFVPVVQDRWEQGRAGGRGPGAGGRAGGRGPGAGPGPGGGVDTMGGEGGAGSESMYVYRSVYVAS